MDPARISHYELHAPLGQGGMGTVYKAYDPRIDRWIAVKTISIQDASQRARFQQEVRAAGSLNHPHITTIYDVGEKDDLAFIVMELVEGDTLAGRLSAPVPWYEAVELLLPICQALAYAHSRGVIHRDVKPANILVSSEGLVKLTDFGVARLEAALRRITESGSTVGTPLYTAPEQIENKAVDGRADLFSLGIVLFELITGRHPFAGESLAQVIHQIMHKPADLRPLAAVTPPAIVEVVGRVLNKDPTARFANADEMAAALTLILDQPETAAIPPGSLSSTPTSSLQPPQPDSLSSSLTIDPVASNISLSTAEETLLRLAFAGHDRLYLEKEFSSGFSGARVLLVTPVRSGGKRLAQMVLKLDTPVAIEAEWQAYQKYVKDTLPPVTARILEEPLTAADGHLVLLRYTFAGGLGQILPESLRTYYARHSGADVARVLEKNVFEAFGEKWWLQRRTTDLIFRREYDRLLPVHLKLEYKDVAEATATPHILTAGNVNARQCSQFEPGQLVQLQNFRLEEVRLDRGELTLQALPPSGSRTNPIRVRVTGLSPYQTFQSGQTVASLDGMVTANQHGLLYQSVETAWPDQDLRQKQITIGDWLYPNPLYDYDALLDQRLPVMESIIHGDLNLENILVTPSSGVAWLIDFATTRRGHNLYDFMRLEVQVITKLLPQTRAKPDDVANLLYLLHRPDLADQKRPADLDKPLAVLTAIRHRVRVCMYSRENWDEYYLGLTLALLGALKFKELEPATRALTLAAATATRSLIEKPDLRQPRLSLRVKTSWPIAARKLTMGIIGVIVLAILAGLGILIWGANPPAPTPTPPPVASSVSVAATSIPTPTPPSVSTSTPTLLPPTLTPVLSFAEGIVVDRVEIFRGPATVYPTIGSALNGGRVQVTGRSADKLWLQVKHPGGPGGYGWLLTKAVALIETVTPPVATAGPPPPPPTFTLTPAPTEPCPRPEFYPTLSDDYPALGCAVDAWRSDFTFQAFERGLMVWRKTPAQIFVMDDSGEWRGYEDPKGPLQPVCREARQTGGLGPVLGFATIWCDKEIDHLGDPLSKESTAEDSRVEEFSQGIVFSLDQKVYILLDNGQWESIEATPKPSPTQTPCSFDAAPEFEVLWQRHGPELGCSTGGIIIIPLIAEELFEGGGMFWRSDTDEVYIVYDRLSDGTTLLEGEWENPTWKWDGSQPDGVGMVPPPGRVEPKRGFGWLWRTHLGGPNGRLGWALDKEYGYEHTGRVQAFEKGIAFNGNGVTVYALLDDGRFFASDSGPGDEVPAPKPSYNDTGFQPDQLFVNFWEQLGGGDSLLGYPLGAAIPDRNYARQRFEHGLMFWWESPQDPQPIWVLYAAGSGATQGDAWQRFDNTWLQGQPEYPPDCPEAGPPLGPKSGFGLVWCYEGIKARIGPPVEAEVGSGNVFPKGIVQFFQSGVMLENPADHEVWILIEGDGWYRSSY